jgi:multidrug efflux pump subunit AcrA (membrane-fusion protein)
MRKVMLFVVVGLVILALVGCEEQGGGQVASDTETGVVPDISVTGEVVPAVWANVSAQAGGKVLEVLVEPGDEVAADDLLVRLDATDAELMVQQAEAAMATAEVQLDLLEASARPAEVAAAEAGVGTADAMLSQATAERNRLAAGAITAEIAAAESALAGADALWKEAQIYDESVRARADELDDWMVQEAALRLRATEQSVKAAQMRVALLRATYAARLREVDGIVDAAAAERDGAQAQLDLLKAGATAEQIAVAEAGIAQAQTALDAAMLALDRTEVRAPFAGTVGSLDARVGELIVAGQPLVTLGDLTTLRVETTDLDEIDVAKVAIGQQVDVSFDALPEQVFAGTITRISPMAAPGSGGVNYTVVIKLDEVDPAVRWGMTAFVDIQVEE